jgi:hypothetical protein
MGRIYKRASRVITYLGPTEDAELETKGIQLLDRFYHHFEPNYDKLVEFGATYTAVLRASELPVLELPDAIVQSTDERTWTWLAALTLGSWTHRLWIVQEQLANSRITMLRGQRLLSWDAVAVVSAFYRLHLIPRRYVSQYWLSNPATADHDPWETCESVFTLWLLRRTASGPVGATATATATATAAATTAPSLLDNLFRYRYLQCRDPRDRIFALLSVSSDAEKLGIVPDYSLPSYKLFIQTSVAILTHEANLFSLARAYEQDNLSDPRCPSWAINVNRPLYQRASSLPHGFSAPHPYTALRAAPGFREADTVLVLRGRVRDRIAFATPQCTRSLSYTLGIRDVAHVETMVKMMAGLSQVLLYLGVTIENTAALCRTLVPHSTWSASRADPRPPAVQAAYDFWCWFRSQVEVLKDVNRDVGADIAASLSACLHLVTSLAPLVLDPATATATGSFSPGDPLSPAQEKAAREVGKLTYRRGRTFCATEHGRVCNAINEIYRGDVIAAFQGADRLFVLRPVGESGRFQLVGEAYVDG